MIQNFRFIEFYNDLIKYISNNLFAKNDESSHLECINQIMHEKHTLDSH